MSSFDSFDNPILMAWCKVSLVCQQWRYHSLAPYHAYIVNTIMADIFHLPVRDSGGRFLNPFGWYYSISLPVKFSVEDLLIKMQKRYQ